MADVAHAAGLTMTGWTEPTSPYDRSRSYRQPDWLIDRGLLAKGVARVATGDAWSGSVTAGLCLVWSNNG